MQEEQSKPERFHQIENQAEEIQTLPQREQHILNLHRQIGQTLMQLRDSINSMIPQEEKDSSGWRMYVFDPSAATQEQVESVGMQGVDLMELFTLSFYPAKDDSGPMQAQPETIRMDLNESWGISTLYLNLFPIGAEDPSFTRLIVDLPFGYVTRSTHPQVISEAILEKRDSTQDNNRDSVMPQGISLSLLEDGTAEAEGILSRVQEISQNLNQGKYRARIFGNLNESPMSPKFLRPVPQPISGPK